jgi:gliding motility-associated-like protein
VITPNELSAIIQLNLQNDDVLVAHFRVLQRENLEVRVMPAGAGTITMNGTLLELPFSQNLLVDETYAFSTSPIDEWSTFVGWQLDNHVLAPNATSPDVTLDFMMQDELVAVYNVIPHQPVTVIVEPVYAGTVFFDDGYRTMDERTEVIVGEATVPFRAAPEEYFDFSHWEVRSGAILGPIEDVSNGIVFNAIPDTVIAHFDRQELQWFVPNSFTPNGDGVNDVFKIFTNAQDPEYFEMRVFNRWGEVMFETRDADNAWEGDFKGGEYYLPDGVYTYYIKLKWIHAEEFEEVRGTIFMFR